ncbi:hypothetical protein ABB37_03229 [Leptomonas pyrrhocoris]|uniref:Uncharacterized protein n=1 Tax=Leptomonas pyrrhocoris TaxID=157538 RepID=A0A0N0DWQ6_LEPPY|nr:hypothetical protein ABB37_03229 [Leptomonas pyrrhocoris]XP_015660510.1 hypothetical protein ABB37_03229 [Leptomonas pyrrhocoris]KPA82070.1 hypothetical protein ABB37_03229 [Leptomonas pyrrhocoris]KPA82071.1 hypothetical protein ABB37_03229 [Leptomonas pyrrhocoris]|eukprot:XP_015660509.1 hypothetical protein ABB37_03229 [Leptomonas pyrrhocoris]
MPRFSGCATNKDDVQTAPPVRCVSRSRGCAAGAATYGNGKTLQVTVSGRASTLITLMPSPSAPFAPLAARPAGTAPSWADAHNRLEVHEGASSYEAVTGQASFLRSCTHSRYSSSVITDTDIEDECICTDTASTIGSASPLRGYRRQHKRRSEVAGAHSLLLQATPTQTTWEESVVTELDRDFSGSATAVLHRGAASTRRTSAVCPSEEPCTFYQCSSGIASSTNLDDFAEEREQRGRGVHCSVSWLNRNESCAAIEEDIPEEIV